MDQPEFEIQTIDPPHLYSHGQKQMACAFAMAVWADSGEEDRRRFVLCEPPALREAA